MENLILKNVSFGYDDQGLIQNLSLKLAAGERLGIVGASGSGKTSLLKIIAGQLVPQAGTLYLGNRNYDEDRNDRILHHPRVALMAQGFDLDPNLTVDENIARHGRHLPPSRLKRYQGKVHRAFSLQKEKDKKTQYLSGGQKQRTALACALIADADLLLLDEPFSQLDYALKHQILDFLETEVWEKTIIMVGHEPTDIMRFCNQVAVLERGRILQKGSVSELYHQPRNYKVARLTGLINALSQEEQAECGIDVALFRPLHCRLEAGEDWTLVQLEYHAFGQLGVLAHPSGVRVKAQIPMEGAYQVGSTWQLSIKKP